MNKRMNGFTCMLQKGILFVSLVKFPPIIMSQKFVPFRNFVPKCNVTKGSAVEPVLSGTVLSGHPASIKWSVVKVPKFMSLNYCNLDLY